MSVQVQLHQFEGPLDLLLYLVKKEEMDVFDIDIHEITKQYLTYIQALKEIDLEKAGEFVYMAASLIQIKARMLLKDEDQDDEDIEDPRRDLARRLSEYERFKDAAQTLGQRDILGRHFWSRPVAEDISHHSPEEVVVKENGIFLLASSYKKAIRKVKNTVHRIQFDLKSVTERIKELKNVLQKGKRVSFSETLFQKTRDEKLVTFLSLLELSRRGFVSVFQTQNFEEIYVEGLKSITDENWDSFHYAEPGGN